MKSLHLKLRCSICISPVKIMVEHTHGQMKIVRAPASTYARIVMEVVPKSGK